MKAIRTGEVVKGTKEYEAAMERLVGQLGWTQEYLETEMGQTTAFDELTDDATGYANTLQLIIDRLQELHERTTEQVATPEIVKEAIDSSGAEQWVSDAWDMMMEFDGATIEQLAERGQKVLMEGSKVLLDGSRKQISAEEMAAHGWDIGEGNYATLFSLGKPIGKDERFEAVITPILPDGRV